MYCHPRRWSRRLERVNLDCQQTLSGVCPGRRHSTKKLRRFVLGEQSTASGIGSSRHAKACTARLLASSVSESAAIQTKARQAAAKLNRKHETKNSSRRQRVVQLPHRLLSQRPRDALERNEALDTSGLDRHYRSQEGQNVERFAGLKYQAAGRVECVIMNQGELLKQMPRKP